MAQSRIKNKNTKVMKRSTSTNSRKSSKSVYKKAKKSSLGLFSFTKRNIIIYVVLFSLVGLVYFGLTRASTDNGIWVDYTKLQSLPTTGAAWNSVVSAMNSLPTDGSGADVSNQDSNHDQYTLAAALACARTNNTSYCTLAKLALANAIGTEVTTLTTPRSPAENQWLPVGRNLASYVIAADVLKLRTDADPNSLGSRVNAWIAGFKGRVGSEGVEFKPFASGSNASAQVGFAYSAVASYLKDTAMLNRAWDAFRTYAGDPTAPDLEKININNAIAGGWTSAPAKPAAKAINPINTTKDGVRIDGADGNDMVRGGNFAVVPGHTQYPWVGMEGFVPAALILHRAGYPAFEVADQSVKRAVDYLWYLYKNVDAFWWDAGSAGRAAEVKHLINTYYGTSYTVVYPAGIGRTVGFTDWTHPNKAAMDATISEPPPPTGDTTLPTTSITYPSNGEQISGPITVSANASDNIGVSRVELYRNNQLVGTDPTSPYQFSWDTKITANGSYTLYSRAYDAAGNSNNSSQIAVSVYNIVVVPDTQAPAVIISQPANGSTVVGKVTIAATATDNTGVTSMQVYVDGKLIASSGNGSITGTWDSAARKIKRGIHTITVRATDAAANFSETSIVVYK